MAVRGGMLQFELEFLQAILGEREKEPDALVGVVLRVANLVRFDRREVVLLLRRRGAREMRRGQHQATQEKKWYFAFHGCFSAGGVPGWCSAGRRGKSIFSSSSSMPIRSWRTISRG